MPTTPQIAGAALLGKDGQTTFSTGLGSDPRFKALVADRAWLNELRERRLTTLNLDRKVYAVLLAPAADGELLVVSHAPGDPLLHFVGSVNFAWDIIQYLLTDPHDAMTIVDDQSRLVFISPIHEAFFGLKLGEGNGKPVEQVIENTRLHEVVTTGKADVGAIQRMRGAERVVSRVPIKRDGRVLGAIGRVMFKGPQQLEALSQRIKDLEGELEFYKRETETLRARDYGLEAIIGRSPAVQRLRAQITKVAALEIPVLIRGESGTGKELVAHALHQLSPRRDRSMINVNAAALPPNLVESELFGYEPGAFTGADKKGRKGKFEQAEGGTIFLDEIGDMPLEVQAKLLRVLQDRIVERVGGDRARSVDFRLVSATNQDLQSMVERGDFRLDLFYRISPIVIELPPLRERIDDIPLLVAKFLQDFAYRHARPLPGISPEALAELAERSWPGNIRQLQHEIERALVFSDGLLIGVEDLSEVPRRPHNTLSRKVEPAAGPRELKQVISEVQHEQIKEAIAACGGNKKKAAANLGISRSFLYKRLAEIEAQGN
ncbi:sigma-54 interaction domain-containing protein [Bradyrhizobium mercantei]|uniref:sigma-54 interaction domain-containing protein n=1 Tax=Bradyrhizobium mercantei TaxID=1904807 RepID=UPI000977FA14|nr:sigma 54-interacting transcriptional regulator [Bradyrhizobium mercantei]